MPNELFLFTIVSFVIGLIMSFIYGFITQWINESKGYEGGFLWGFFLGWIGIIIVAFKENINRPVQSSPITYAPPPDSWKCRCGRHNAPYVTSCVCGITKSDAIAISHLSTEEANNIALLREYKNLLDSGVITQEEFDQKKKSILSN